MANIVKSKGTAVLMEISSVYTAFANVKSVSITGARSTTFEAKLLDGSVYTKNPADGYTTGPTINIEKYYDPDDSVDQAFIAKLAAPVDTNFKVTYADATPLSEIWAGTGFGMDKTATPSDGLSATLTIQTSGAPS